MKLETQFKEPQDVEKMDSIFGGNISKLMPRFSALPEEFREYWHNDRNKWCCLANQWMHGDLQGYSFVPKEGIDMQKAFRHAGAIMRSFEPKHEHKIAGVAYLLSLWLNDYEKPQKETV
jgi:hypothetical protein